MKIVRHRSGGKKSIYGKYKCVVIGVKICQAAYLQLFRGYKMKFGSKDVLWKEVVSDKKMIDRETSGL